MKKVFPSRNIIPLTVEHPVFDSFYRMESLDMRPRLVSGDDTPIPYAGALEDAWLPSAERIVGALREAATE